MTINFKIVAGILIAVVFLVVASTMTYTGNEREKELSIEVLKHVSHMDTQFRLKAELSKLLLTADKEFISLKNKGYQIQKDHLKKDYESYHRMACSKGKPLAEEWYFEVNKIEKYLDEAIALNKKALENKLSLAGTYSNAILLSDENFAKLAFAKLESANNYATYADKVMNKLIIHEYKSWSEPLFGTISLTYDVF